MLPSPSEPPLERPTAGRTPLYVLLFLVAFGAGCLLLFWPRLQGAKWAARLTHCKNNLKRIELALGRYHDLHGSYPPAVTNGPDGKPWHSWRTLILAHDPDAQGVYDRYRLDEPWDGPHNRALLADRVAGSLFRCPAEGWDATGETSYLAVVGERTLWPPGRGCTRAEVTDGRGRTLQVVEYDPSGIRWSEPRDLEFEYKTWEVQTGKAPSIKSRHPSVPYVAFADGSVTPLSSDTPPETVKSLLLRDDGPKPEEWP